MRTTFALILLAGCLPPPAASTGPAAAGAVNVDACKVSVAAAPAVVTDAGVPDDAAPASDGDAGAPAPTLVDAQAYLDTHVKPGLETNRDALASCVPAGAGVLVLDVSFTMTPAGDVGDISIGGRTDPSIQPCVAGILRGLALPAPHVAIEGSCRLRHSARPAQTPAPRPAQR